MRGCGVSPVWAPSHPGMGSTELPLFCTLRSVFEPRKFQPRVRRRDHFIAAVSEEEKVFVIGGQRELSVLPRQARSVVP